MLLRADDLGNRAPGGRCRQKGRQAMTTRTGSEYRREDGLLRERDTRDPEDRVVEPGDREGVREKMFDKTVADSFPASDPPSSIPDPEEDSF